MENKNLKTKILYVVTRPPYPALDGTRERILGELKKLNEDFDVSLLIVTDEKVAEKTVQHLQSILTGEVVVFNLLKIKCYLRSFVGLFSSLPLQCSYFYSQKVKKWLQMNEYKYKVIHFHTIRLGEYIKDLKKNRISSKASRLLLCFHTYNPETQNLVFLGNLLYPPNLQGMELFCKNIFPLIFKNKTETKLFIIGRGGKEHFSGLRNVEPLGFVDNPYDFISKQALFINPATFGAGVPSKVLLAMAIGIPVVSTNNNISGIEDIQDKENVCLIDHNTPEKSAEKILALLSDEKNRKQIGNAGKVLALNNHKLSRNYAKLKNFIQNK
ncbi:MAG: glycosyltransferase family 4 protein [Candidatus Nomurabacteria bacterium]|nr:glycosyltransferase family 4 protein [Candidatus Nomurabacteria bacterium]